MTALASRPRTTAAASAGALVDAAIDGDEFAWSLLCDRHMAGVRSVALARLRDPHAADDVAQETLVRAWTRLHQLDDPERFGPWLKTIAARVAIDHIRAMRPTSVLEDLPEVIGSLAPLEDHVVEREQAAVLHAHLAELREVDRTALWQRDALGAPVAELADELGMTTGSVRVLLTRARTKLRDGYAVAVAPLIAVAVRGRARWAGLGEAGAVALVAPVMVVAAIAGVTVADFGPADDAPQGIQTIAAAPAPRDERPAETTPPQTAAPAVTPAASAPAPVPTVARRTAPQPSAEAPAAAPKQRPSVGVGPNRAGFQDTPPTDDEEDVETETPAGPLEGFDIYFEDAVDETDVDETDGGETGCLIC